MSGNSLPQRQATESVSAGFGISIAIALALWTGGPVHAQDGARPHGFGPDKSWLAYTGAAEQVVLDGDVDGDGYDDLILFHRSQAGMVGWVDVMRGDGTRFLPAVRWQSFFCIGSEVPLVGDFNGDGRTDIITFLRSSQTGNAIGDVYVGLSTGSAFTSTLWHEYFCVDNEIPLVGDFDGDGRDDIATCTRGALADVYVALSTGSGFAGLGVLWSNDFCAGDALPMVGDFNGDGVDDLAAFVRSTLAGHEGEVQVALSLGEVYPAFIPGSVWHGSFCYGTELPAIGDLNADGFDDILTWVPGSSEVYAAISDGFSFVGTAQRWHASLNAAAGGVTFLAGKYNGDANADVATVSYTTSAPAGVGTANIALCGGLAQALPNTSATERDQLSTDFGYGTMGVPSQNKSLATRPASEQRYLLCVLLSGPVGGGATAFAMTAPQAQALCFGPAHPNMASYFSEMSGGKFTWRPANINNSGGTGVIGPLAVATAPLDTWTFALQTIDGQFNYALYDANNDGKVDSTELVVLVIDNFSENAGANRQRTITADGKTVTIDVAAAGHRSAFQNPAHELSHSLGTQDLYNLNCYAQGLTLMSCTAGVVPATYWHLDAWHKMRLGWISPRVYDISEFPGGAWIGAAQESGISSFQAPVMLYDTRRGTKEHYTIEFRNNTYEDGSTGWLGYDQNVVGRGMATWYARTQNDNTLRLDPLRIGAGRDSILQSSPAGDDFVSSNTIFVGSNSIMDSTPSGDDGYIGDNTCFSTLTPRTIATRVDSEVYNNPAASLSPNWWSMPSVGNPPANVPSGITMRTTAFGGGGYLEWGATFSPWLDEPLSSSLQARGSYYFGGNLGVRSRGADGTAFAVVRRADGSETPMITELTAGETQWDGERAYFRVPLSAPSGQGTIRIYRSDTRAMVSNAWPITIQNRYHDFLTTHFSAGERTVDAMVEPKGDPDHDGLANVIEFVLSSNPRDGSDGHQYIKFDRHVGSVSFEWSGLTTSYGLFTVDPEVSTNLTDWYPMPAALPYVSGQYTIYTSSMLSPGSPCFFRLRVDCPDYHL